MLGEKQERVKRAIDSYLEEQLLRIATVGGSSVEGGSEKQLLCNEIVEEQLLMDAENYENFLTPE